MSRKRKGILSKFIRQAYKALGSLNTASTIMSGNPTRISRHLTRKRTVKLGGSIIPKTR